MSDTRSIIEDDQDCLSQVLIEIGDETPFSDVLGQLEENRRRSVPKRMQAFRDLQHRMEVTSSRCLGTS